MDTSKIPLLIFADGACSGNPGPGGWGTVVVFPQGEVKELGGGTRQTTNNQMELTAVIEGLLEVAKTPGKVEVYTDSVYVIRGITQWIWGWRSRDWKTADGKDVANVPLWKELSAVVAQRGQVYGKTQSISWHFVRGHSGVPGNERCDVIATGFARGPRPNLYQGPLLQYSIAIHDIPEDTSLPEPREKSAPKAAAFSYLSLVNGVPMRHSSWPQCEGRVKGRPGAKFKKSANTDDEAAILKSWGYGPGDVKEP
ncbi:MAG: ribonuclease HI [Methylotenera sp.]|nr:ribonuclease HI [Oligoflexia bacterium]